MAMNNNILVPREHRDCKSVGFYVGAQVSTWSSRILLRQHVLPTRATCRRPIICNLLRGRYFLSQYLTFFSGVDPRVTRAQTFHCSRSGQEHSRQSRFGLSPEPRSRNAPVTPSQRDRRLRALCRGGPTRGRVHQQYDVTFSAVLIQDMLGSRLHHDSRNRALRRTVTGL